MTECPEYPAEASSLCLTAAEQWTLHDVLVERLGREDESGATPSRQAFETLDGGGQRFTRPQLEAIQRALARAHHTRRWEADRPQLEAVLHRVAVALEAR